MWGTLNIGGMELREEIDARQDGETVQVHGQESHPPSTRAAVTAAHANLTQLPGQVVPVVFTDKDTLSGFYRIESARSDLMDYANGAVLTATWQVEMERVGGLRDIEIESRVPAIARQSALGVTPVFWHAPAGGAADYFTGSTIPAARVVRASADGVNVPVYTGLPVGVAPRWSASADSYLVGAARLLFDGQRRMGTVTPPLVVWEMNNGLVRITSGGPGRVQVSCWDAGQWRTVNTYLLTSAAAIAVQPEVTILRNAPEEVAIRLTYPQLAAGRTTLDLSLRRGSRVVIGRLARHNAAVLSVALDGGSAGTVQTGGVLATSADADGNRWAMGTSAATTLGAAGSIQVTGTTLPFWLGHEIGPAPQAGDAFADLLAQYLGTTTREMTRVVPR